VSAIKMIVDFRFLICDFMRASWKQSIRKKKSISNLKSKIKNHLMALAVL